MALENITGNESLEELQRLQEVFTRRIQLLDEKKAATKPEIFSKVRGEYEAKLLEIQVLLEEKGAGAEEALAAALSEQGSLTARVEEIRNQSEELELRATIGEVEEADFAAQSAALSGEVGSINSRLQELAQQIDKYQRILGVPSEPAAPVQAPQAPAVQAAPPAAPEPPRPPEPLKPVAPPPPAPAVPEPAAQPHSMPAFGQKEVDELTRSFDSILGALGQEPPQPPEPAPQAAEPEVPASTAPEPQELPAEEESHEGELKCPKCGAFNRADNWYCEKCGNELLNASDLLGGK
jgi:hypothetical protein